MSDLIDRQAAIDALKNDMASLDHIIKGMSAYDVRLEAYVSQRNQVDYDIDTINNLPPAHPEPCEDAVSRKAAIDGLNDAVHEHNITDFDAVATILALPPVTPKQRTGKWILDRSGAYCCSECMEPCAGYVMMKPRDKFCKMCGAKMEGEAE